jgi:Flp pilus assembly protein CpaB
MRTVSWLLLILSFALGIGCAFIVRYYMFEAKPVPIAERKPAIKILIAKQIIPQGAEITAQAIMFVEVPITELPTAAITNFSQVYRRRSAYPISIGCPICEDLLLPYQEKDFETEKYIPAGMQVVSLEIEQIRLNDQVVEPSIPITNTLSPDQRIDIRMFPREKSQGKFSERKNQLLKAYMSKNEVAEKGELLLENIEIHQIQNQFSPNNQQRQVQTLTLVLEKNEAAQLTSAARKGRLRIVPHRQPNQIETAPIQNNTTENSENITVNRTTGNVTDKTLDHLLINKATDNIINNENNTANNIIGKPIEIITDIVEDTPLISSEVSGSTATEINQHIPEPILKKSSSLLFIPSEIPVSKLHEEIRNDICSIAETPLPGFHQEKTGISEPLEYSKDLNVKRIPLCLSSPILEIGLPVANELEKPFPKNYSPWGQSSIAIEPELETETNNSNHILTPPLLRNQKNL